MRIVRLPRAIEDIDAIWLYVAERNLLAANRLVEKISSAIDKLVEHPRRGAPKFAIGDGIRSLSVGPYRIYYVVRSQVVEIVRVLHSARDISRIDF